MNTRAGWNTQFSFWIISAAYVFGNYYRDWLCLKHCACFVLFFLLFSEQWAVVHRWQRTKLFWCRSKMGSGYAKFLWLKRKKKRFVSRGNSWNRWKVQPDVPCLWGECYICGVTTSRDKTSLRAWMFGRASQSAFALFCHRTVQVSDTYDDRGTFGCSLFLNLGISSDIHLLTVYRRKNVLRNPFHQKIK